MLHWTQHPRLISLKFWSANCVTSRAHSSPRFLQVQLESIRAMAPAKKSSEKITSFVTGKRKAASATQLDGSKKAKITSSSTDPLRQPHDRAQEAEDNGIVLRKFYPPEMSIARAQAYNTDQIPRPIEFLMAALTETANERAAINVKDAVVHWFKWDLRTRDNKALYMASQKAQEKGVPLICLYIVSPQDFEAHLTAPIRVDFILRTLEVLRADLDKLNIPLYTETVGKRKTIPGRIVELLQEWGASHLFCNMEYEVDELRREARMVRSCMEKRIAMHVTHDTCVVSPGELQSGTGKQYSVYTPWYRSWVSYIHMNTHVLDLFDPPASNPENARKKYAKLYDCNIPEAPENKKLAAEEATRYKALWPAGEHEAHLRLEKFTEKRITNYGDRRNFPADPATSNISVHLAAGTLSARSAIHAAKERNSSKKLDSGISGIQTWISEVAWRDFYKHVLVHWPYVCMNKPFKPEYTNIEWEYNDKHFEAWTEGRTGYPIVDAAMRQLNSIGWMHNRCRMIVASFLAKDLLIDWRMGERYFMEHLIDGDFASNNGGWGFSASTGVDPQPYFRIFNPLLQSEKFDAEGEYIRKWVPELKEVKGKAIHDPYDRGSAKQAQKTGYPKRIVEHKAAREKTLARYKTGLGRDTT